jgi:hypothetical protein
VYDGSALRKELFKCGGIGKVALYEGDAQRLKLCGLCRISDQRANRETAFAQALA